MDRRSPKRTCYHPSGTEPVQRPEEVAEKAELRELPDILAELERVRGRISVRVVHAATIAAPAPRRDERRPLLTVSEVARALSVSVPTVHRWAKDREHPLSRAVRSLGVGTLRFDPVVVDAIRSGEGRSV